MRRLSGRCEEVGREEGYHTDCEWAARTGDAVWVHGAGMGWERQEEARAEPACTVSFHGGYSRATQSWLLSRWRRPLGARRDTARLADSPPDSHGSH